MAVQITTTTLPNAIQSVAYSQTIQTTGGQAPLVFSVSVGSLPAGLSLNTSTGAITGTPTTPGLVSFTILVTDNNSTTDTQAFSVRTYAPLNTSPDPDIGDTCVFTTAGSQIHFTSTGGSGNYLWSVDGGNLINPVSGLFTAINGGTYTVTLVDQDSGQVATVCVTITSQAQFCVEGVSVVQPADSIGGACCERNVECGDRIQLQVPSFHVIENGERERVIYGDLVQAKIGEASALQSTSASAGATGNSVSFVRDAYYEIVTSFDMAATAAGEIGIGWSTIDTDSAISSIQHAVVWYTDTGVRKVQVRNNGAVEASSTFEIVQGDVVSFGRVGGDLALYINNVLVFTSAQSLDSCGEFLLDIGIELANKTIGGFVANLTWSIVTSGTASQVGSIDAGGVYTSPNNPISGVVLAKGSLNNANFFVNIRNIKPTPRFMKANPFLGGRRSHVWVTDKRASDNDIIRIASDGTPDALQNPDMIYLGVLEGSATFAEDNQTQDFTNDEGIYQTVITEERATLTGTFLEVRDLDKLALMMQRSTLHPKVKGVTELSVGGKTCGGCDLRAVLIVESGNCGSGWDVIYMPRVQNVGNLSLEIGKKANSKYALNFRVLPDTTRPIGKQLYSIYQIDNCADEVAGGSCEVGEL